MHDIISITIIIVGIATRGNADYDNIYRTLHNKTESDTPRGHSAKGISMIILYMNSASPNARKISIMLAETNLPYTAKSVDRQPDGSFVPSFLAINPNATVPAIVDEDSGISVFESGAILYYLAEKARILLPTELKRRTEVVKWLMFEVANMGPVMGELYHYILLPPGVLDECHLQRYREKVTRYCSVLDRALEGQTYLCGDYSIADIALYPWCAILEDMADINLSNYSNLSRWATAIAARPALQSTGHSGRVTAGSGS